MNTLKINGTTIPGIYVDAAISYNKPAKRVQTFEVPGRNGNLIIDEGTFDNVMITYPVYEKQTFPAEFDDLVNWLASLEGYQRIECSNDPGHYRLGRFVVPQTPTVKRLNRDGYYQLSFDCKPQRWLLSGEEDTEVDANPQETYEGEIATFEAEALDVISDLKVAIEPVQSGSGDPSPTNIRPISGWDDAKISNYKLPDGYTLAEYISIYHDSIQFDGITNWDRDDILISATFKALEVTQYQPVFSAYSAESSRCTRLIFMSNNTINFLANAYSRASNPTRIDVPANQFNNVRVAYGWAYVNGIAQSINTQAGNANTATKLAICGTGSWIQYKGIYVRKTLDAGGDPLAVLLPCTNPQGVAGFYDYIGERFYTANDPTHISAQGTPNDSSVYLPVNPVTIPFGQTVYGGTLDVMLGKLIKTMGIVDLGTLNWTYSGGILRAPNVGNKLQSDASALANIICSNYTTRTRAAVVSLSAVGICVNTGAYGEIWVYDPAYTDANTFKTAMNGAKLVFELATPIEVDLTAQEIALLTGTNNIWANTGDVSVTVTTPTNFINPGNFPSRPLLRIYGTGTVRINDVYITTAAHTQPYIDIDCEMQECYYEDTNMNEYVTFSTGEYPELEPGNNYVLLGSGITRIDVTPRWWEL